MPINLLTDCKDIEVSPPLARLVVLPMTSACFPTAPHKEVEVGKYCFEGEGCSAGREAGGKRRL